MSRLERGETKVHIHNWIVVLNISIFAFGYKGQSVTTGLFQKRFHY